MGKHKFLFKKRPSASSFRFLKIFALLFCFLLSELTLNAQAREGNSQPQTSKKSKASDGFDLSKLIVGGGFGLQFGSVTLVELSPTVGYLFSENFLAGLGAKYIYFEDNTFANTFSTNLYGGSIFGQYFFLENFIAHAEYELLSVETAFEGDSRVNVGSFFVGGGYRSYLSGSSYVGILLLYNLNDDINSPYTNPVVRVNLGFGL